LLLGVNVGRVFKHVAGGPVGWHCSWWLRTGVLSQQHVSGLEWSLRLVIRYLLKWLFVKDVESYFRGLLLQASAHHRRVFLLQTRLYCLDVVNYKTVSRDRHQIAQDICVTSHKVYDGCWHILWLRGQNVVLAT
jgi:hypothetical protein